MDAELAAEILAMAERDQAMRRRATEGAGSWDRAIDLANTTRLKEIVASSGWPTMTRVGQAAEHAAWLLAQHATHDLAFQKEVLRLLRDEPAVEVCPKHAAYLEDRINMLEGQPQRFGTQIRQSASGEWEPYALADPGHVDELRASVGLGRLRDYIAGFRR